MEKYEQLKKIIYKANVPRQIESARGEALPVYVLRLTDVLLALMKFAWNGMGVSRVKDDLYNLAHLWNCLDDNLNHQSDGTKQFLIDLLVQ